MKRICDNKGFSLIETVVALAIIGIVAVIATSIVLSQFKARNISIERQECFNITKSVVDEIGTNRYAWKDDGGLGAWLVDHGYSKGIGTNYSIEQRDSNDYLYTVEININVNMANFVDVKVSTSSNDVNDVFIVKRFRVVNS